MQTLIFKAHVNRHFPSVYVCSNFHLRLKWAHSFIFNAPSPRGFLARKYTLSV